MMISMPIWLLLLILAAATVAGCTLALWWVNETELRQLRHDIDQLKKRERLITDSIRETMDNKQ